MEGVLWYPHRVFGTVGATSNRPVRGYKIVAVGGTRYSVSGTCGELPPGEPMTAMNIRANRVAGGHLGLLLDRWCSAAFRVADPLPLAGRVADA